MMTHASKLFFSPLVDIVDFTDFLCIYQTLIYFILVDEKKQILFRKFNHDV